MRKILRTATAGGLLAGVTAACLGVGLGACSQGPEPAGAPTAHSQSKPRKPVTIGDPSTDDMSSAVNMVRGAAPVQLKFEVMGRPSPGQSLEVKFALIPVDPAVTQVTARFEGEAGLSLVDGADLPAVDKPAQGVPILHKVSVVARADGIYLLTAAVHATIEADSRTTLFSVPLIAGAGLVEPAIGKAAAQSPRNR